MAKMRLNPPKDSKRVSDWLGRKVKSKRTFENGYIKIPAGAIGVVSRATGGTGLDINFQGCSCCGASPKFSGVSDLDIDEVLE